MSGFWWEALHHLLLFLETARLQVVLQVTMPLESRGGKFADDVMLLVERGDPYCFNILIFSMVFIFIWFQFLTSFLLSSELSFNMVIVRPAVPRGSCILTASVHPPHLFLLNSALGTGCLLHPSFLFSRQALSPAAPEWYSALTASLTILSKSFI